VFTTSASRGALVHLAEVDFTTQVSVPNVATRCPPQRKIRHGCLRKEPLTLNP